jgi:hypothetical protein
MLKLGRCKKGEDGMIRHTAAHETQKGKPGHGVMPNCVVAQIFEKPRNKREKLFVLGVVRFVATTRNHLFTE